jgi:hypothetical protein
MYIPVNLGTRAETQGISTLVRPVHLNEVSCTGEEDTIFQCISSTESSSTCTDSKAGVMCQGVFVHVF